MKESTAAQGHEHPHDDRDGDRHVRSRWVFWGFAAMGGFLLITEHRAHVLGILPYLFLLACPLMHMFHHGHGGHHRHHGGAGNAGGNRSTEEHDDGR